MKLRLLLALCALPAPAFAQNLPTPNLGVGTKLNGTLLTTTATKGQGTSVADPGSGDLESLLPVQTVTGTSKAFGASDLYKETRRSNSGAAMSDTFPASATIGMINGSRMFVNNVDTFANLTINAGAGTTVNGAASAIVGPGRSSYWIYDASATNWRPTGNSLTALLAANNLSELASAPTARTNLGLAAIAASGSASDLSSGQVAVARGGTGDSGTAWTAFTSSLDCQNGTLTSGSISINYKTIGKTVFLRGTISITTANTCGYPRFTIPFTPSGYCHFVGRESIVNGKMFIVQVAASTGIASNYDNTNPAVSGASLPFSGSCEST